MITSTPRLAVALAALLTALGVVLAAPALARTGPPAGPSGHHAGVAATGEASPEPATAASAAQYPAVTLNATEPQGPSAEKKSSGGAARWLMLGSGLLLGVGIGFFFVFMRKGPSDRG